ncbi:hypothetical protein LTR91_026224 [Friedmanniomyces endolithicus]|uniref:Uncharacterized protein n=1 Tax=Friedmanniomyces endolithicus TaxID=329885 RepID=A0AAN6K2A5_9PEZI|nr:hypothetical protein LTS09_010240 [Friedmanniomyces endolithicus]KAK0873015.1 hypothetical protein LTS02_000951 [Friedmanniomyces endolithicus]KAK0906900.1 hypothetical protein LTR02_005734 [Friedmanniomyces endolithicus]KAK0949715.1 hypothetical protein LTR91_026224 [Friedmanniomyces endolithicus]KAK1009466.1 hypothetical protein LTS01_001958 [Friedmanniomyces endolithicus]
MPNLPFRSKKEEGFSGGRARDVQRNALLAEEFERRTPQQNAIGQSFRSGNYERHRPARADWSDTWEGSANSSHSDVIKQHRARDAEFQRRYREAMAPKAGPAGSMAGLAGSKAGPARSNPQLARADTERPRSSSRAASARYGSGSASSLQHRRWVPSSLYIHVGVRASREKVKLGVASPVPRRVQDPRVNHRGCDPAMTPRILSAPIWLVSLGHGIDAYTDG